MIFISGIFFVLDAEFLGVVQIIVYSGSVVALYAFAMMFFDTSKDIIESYKNEWVVCILCFGIAVVLVCIFGMPLLGSNLEAVADSQNLLNIAEMNNIQMIG